jgi:hypothetical protein
MKKINIKDITICLFNNIIYSRYNILFFLIYNIMYNIEDYQKFEDNYLIEMLDLYNDINSYCKNNAFDILNKNNKNNENNDFIQLIFNNTIIPSEELKDDSNDEEFMYV